MSSKNLTNNAEKNDIDATSIFDSGSAPETERITTHAENAAKQTAISTFKTARAINPLFTLLTSAVFMAIHFLLFQDLKTAMAATAMIPATQFWLTPIQYAIQDSIAMRSNVQIEGLADRKTWPEPQKVQ